MRAKAEKAEHPVFVGRDELARILVVGARQFRRPVTPSPDNEFGLDAWV